MFDPRLEDHAVGLELQIVELVEQKERAARQGRGEVLPAIEREIDELQSELAVTADRLAS